jgi:hypothetical protein
MMNKAIFEGLVVDEFDNQVDVVYVGDEPCYVVDDEGFRRHIPSDTVDRQVLEKMQEMIVGHENILSDQAAKLLGQDDIFSKAMIEKQIRDMENQFPLLLKTGIPEETRAYLGMIGFRIRINIHGEVIEIIQPGMVGPYDEE